MKHHSNTKKEYVKVKFEKGTHQIDTTFQTIKKGFSLLIYWQNIFFQVAPYPDTLEEALSWGIFSPRTFTTPKCFLYQLKITHTAILFSQAPFKLNPQTAACVSNNKRKLQATTLIKRAGHESDRRGGSCV